MKYKKILIIGSGGREHAIGWKIKQSQQSGNIYFAPGNGGTSYIGENLPIPVTNTKELLKVAKEKEIDLTIVGPEVPLADGIVDEFQKEGLKIFGPTKNASRLEWDKKWAAEFMERHNIPYPQTYSFNTYEKALAFLSIVDPKKIVLKATGLAAGKGVLLPNSRQEAIDALKNIMVEKVFGDAGNTVVIQERIEGPEVSIHAITDGKTIMPLLPAQDHKRLLDNDEGPNTGGMGAYAPVPFITKKQLEEIRKNILEPTIAGMEKEGNPFVGVLYAGLMMTKEGPKVLEYNCRFGDPETQPLMMLLQSDLLDLLIACVIGELHKAKIEYKEGSAVCVVLTSQGYPGDYEKGKTITGLQKAFTNSTQVFHSGTKVKEKNLLTDGGRVMGITAYASTFTEARKYAYDAIGKDGILFEGMNFRTDIGTKNKK